MAQKRAYWQSKGRGLFEDDLSRNMLSERGIVLEKKYTVFDFERFRNILEDKIIKDANKTGSGRPLYDPILLLKILFLQRFGSSRIIVTKSPYNG